MGQYFRAVVKIDEQTQCFAPMGQKLLEHSWIQAKSGVNSLCLIIFKKLVQIAWIGDYAYDETVLDPQRIAKKFPNIPIEELYQVAWGTFENEQDIEQDTEGTKENSTDYFETIKGEEGDFEVEENLENLDDWAEWEEEENVNSLENLPQLDFEKADKEYFLVNHDKKIFLNFKKYIEKNTNENGLTLHPLPLLTAIGNGEGLGDFYPEQLDQLKNVGLWAWDKIEITDTQPTDYEEVMYFFNR